MRNLNKTTNKVSKVRTLLKSLFSIIMLFIASVNAMAQTYPPSCVITAPHTNAYYQQNTDVVINVYSTDKGKSQQNGTVTKVEFFVNGTKIGESTSQTNNYFTFTYKCVQTGEYLLTARATNSSGVTFTSVGQYITVGTAAVSPKGMSPNKGKYLANIIPGSVQTNYNTYWNGVTAENACKWGSVEGTRDVMNWGGADVTYNHAKNNNMMFRYHAALWAAQYPSNWLLNLSTADARAEVVEYMQAIAARYKYIDQIDVLNEQLGNHQADNQKFRDKFSGITNCPATNYDWQIWLFEEARKAFPNTKLVLNDYGLENDQNAINTQLGLIKVLRDRGLIDGFGTQAHCFNIDGLSATALKSSLDLMTNGGVPIYVTELDLNGGVENESNQSQQLSSFQTHFPVYWEHPAVAGISIWGYISGSTWIGGTGLLQNGTEKSALTWLKTYVTGRPNVGYPFNSIPGSCCSVAAPTVAVASYTYNVGDVATQLSATGTSLKWYLPDGTTSTTAPTPSTTTAGIFTYGVTQTTTCESSRTNITVTVNKVQTAFGGTPKPIPGTIQFEEYDEGGQDVAYYDSSPGSEVTPVVNYRTTEDVDIENCTDAGAGYNIGYGVAGEWLEYTVNVATAGTYNLTLRVACNGDGRTISLTAKDVAIASNVAIPNTAGWQTWTDVTVNNITLTAGVQIIRVTIGATDYVNLNYMTFAPTGTNPPTVTTPVAYCQGATATALTATGTALKWYTTATGGTASTTAPTPSTAAVGSTTYYVTQTLNSTESPRASIVVNITATPAAPTVTSPVNYTEGDVATALTATGTGLKWYTVSTGGTGSATAPIPSTATAGTTNYYVSQTSGTCESSRATIAVVVTGAVVPTVSLKAGWNLIGCPIDGSTNIANALSSIWSQVESVKNADYYWHVTNTIPGLNTLLKLNWGEGYLIKVKTDCELDWIVR